MQFTELLACSSTSSPSDDIITGSSMFDELACSPDTTTTTVDLDLLCDSQPDTPTTTLFQSESYSEQCYTDFGLILPNNTNDNSPLGSPSSESDSSSLGSTASPAMRRTNLFDNMAIIVIDGVGWANIDNNWYDFRPDHAFNDTHRQRIKYSHPNDYSRCENDLDLHCQIKAETRKPARNSVITINDCLNKFKKRSTTKNKKRSERPWEFLLRLLDADSTNPRLIEWLDKDRGLFRLNKPKIISKQWGSRRNNECMTYEKFSRALRHYYRQQILQPVYGKKLVYKFGPNSTGW